MTRGRAARAAAIVTVILGSALLGSVWAEKAEFPILPHVPPKTPILFDVRPVAVTITTFWHKVPRTVTVDQLLKDRTLWRQMHFGDWDKVPSPLRERALGNMLDQYRYVLEGPSVWKELSVHDWDEIPQPVRAMAYQRMIEHWTGYYDVGAGYAESPQLVARTVSAIVMAESWFEHRAINVNEWGNRDLGLAGCSDHCRRVLEEMAAEGTVDFLLNDHDYFDPWNGTRVAAVWFGRELVRVEGDLDLAVAAYHRGLPAARKGKGADYAANVQRLKRQYISGGDGPPAWAFLMAQSQPPPAPAIPLDHRLRDLRESLLDVVMPAGFSGEAPSPQGEGDYQ